MKHIYKTLFIFSFVWSFYSSAQNVPGVTYDSSGDFSEMMENSGLSNNPDHVLLLLLVLYQKTHNSNPTLQQLLEFYQTQLELNPNFQQQLISYDASLPKGIVPYDTSRPDKIIFDDYDTDSLELEVKLEPYLEITGGTQYDFEKRFMYKHECHSHGSPLLEVIYSSISDRSQACAEKNLAAGPPSQYVHYCHYHGSITLEMIYSSSSDRKQACTEKNMETGWPDAKLHTCFDRDGNILNIVYSSLSTEEACAKYKIEDQVYN